MFEDIGSTQICSVSVLFVCTDSFKYNYFSKDAL
jgi:hypothetical protein